MELYEKLKKYIFKNIDTLKFTFLIFFFLFYFYFDNQNFQNSNQIFLETKIGNNQGFHPKVISFPNLWNGYKYWIAYTPYPNSNVEKENPTINASNDLINWISPKGCHNPLDIPKNPGINHYNSDTHLLYNIDTKELEIFWRYVNIENNTVIIYKKTSKNGIKWSRRLIFLKSKNRLEKDYMSPSIIYENKIYKIWYINKNKIYYIEKNANILSKPRMLNINYKNKYNAWHFDLIYNSEKKLYELISCIYINQKNYRKMPLYYTSSKDNIIWNKPFLIMKPSKNQNKWDSEGLYRSSLLYEKGNYYLFYSGHDKFYNVGIGLMYGKTLKDLKPLV